MIYIDDNQGESHRTTATQPHRHPSRPRVVYDITGEELTSRIEYHNISSEEEKRVNHQKVHIIKVYLNITSSTTVLDNHTLNAWTPSRTSMKMNGIINGKKKNKKKRSGVVNIGHIIMKVEIITNIMSGINIGIGKKKSIKSGIIIDLIMIEMKMRATGLSL